jgi:hypothetical protein
MPWTIRITAAASARHCTMFAKAASISSLARAAKNSICRPMVATAAFAFAVCNARRDVL